MVISIQGHGPANDNGSNHCDGSGFVGPLWLSKGRWCRDVMIKQQADGGVPWWLV